MTRLLTLIAAVAALACTTAEAAPKIRVLYLDQSVGFRHAPVTRPKNSNGPTLSEIAMAEIGAQSGAFTVESTQDARTITPEKLKDIDVLAFYTTGALPISAEAWAAIQQWIASGKGGFVGLHSATDTEWDYSGPGQTYTAFINGRFAGHPWTQGTPITVQALGGRDPVNKAWPARFAFAEEIYQYSDYDPAKVRVLQALDFSEMALKRPWFVPITWTRQIGEGRLFFTNLGHTPSTWNDPRYRAQILDAVRWTAHRAPFQARGAGVEPNPDEQALWALRSLLAYDGRPKAEIETRVARLAKADPAWLRDAAARTAALRPLWPAKPDSDRGPFDNAYKAILQDVVAKSGG